VGGGHAIDHFLKILGEAGLPVQYGVAARLRFAPERRERGRRRLEAIGKRMVVLHPGSGSSLKNWPLARYMALARRLQETGTAEPLFIVGEAEVGMAAQLGAAPERERTAVRRARRMGTSGAAGATLCRSDACPHASGRMTDIAGWLTDRFAVASGLTLAEVAEMLSAASAYAGNDSGITHLAAALGVPTVAVFGPTDATMWGPRGAHVRCVVAQDRSVQGLHAIEVAHVWSALEAALGES
jgi:ADP-heptose:LPS heptosyltransferase